MLTTDTLTFCASDVPVMFRPAWTETPNNPFTLLASVWLVGPPIRMPGERERPVSRMLFKFVFREDPGRKFGRKLFTIDGVEWDGLTLSVLGTAVPTAVPKKTDSWQRYAADDAWMFFAELIC
jgi:hypothetical protein